MDLMNSQLKSVFGVYQTWPEAERAVSELHSAGFSNRDLSILVHSDNVDKDELAPERHTQSPKGLAVGALSGAFLGGGLGLLAGFGTLVIPGIGPMLAMGPILSALSGIGMGGVAGGVAGAFIGVGFPEHKLTDLQKDLKEGGILVSVHAESFDLRKEAYQILQDTGAEGISSSDHTAVSSVEDLSPSFNPPNTAAEEDFISRKQF
jgi:hypothetical protein